MGTYQNVQLIPIQPLPSQQVAAALSGQQVTLNIYTRDTYGVSNLYMDIYLAGALLLAARMCENGNEIVRNAYFGFIGDFAFWDQQGASDPQYTGLGSRWVLAYYS